MPIVSEIINRTSTLGVNSFINDGFNELLHRSSEAVLVDLIGDYLFNSGESSDNLALCEFAVIAKPLAIGTPVQADFLNEKYVIGKTHRMCHARKDNTNNTETMDEFHFEISLKIRVPLDTQVYQSVLNLGPAVGQFAYLVRLFWTLL